MIWKDVIGYEGYYQVNILGQVKSLPRDKFNGRKGKINHYKTPEKLLIPAFSGRSTNPQYLFYTFCVNKKMKTVYVHKLIARHFIANPNNYDEVNHKNGIKTDNRVENLEWCTHKQNIHHAVDNDLIHRGENNYNHRLTARQVIDIRKDFRKLKEIADTYGVSFSLISRIKLRKTWKHV